MATDCHQTGKLIFFSLLHVSSSSTNIFFKNASKTLCSFSGQRYKAGRTLELRSPRTSTDSFTPCTAIGVSFVASTAKRKEKKDF